jgi:hypothetical protein
MTHKKDMQKHDAIDPILFDLIISHNYLPKPQAQQAGGQDPICQLGWNP